MALAVKDLVPVRRGSAGAFSRLPPQLATVGASAYRSLSTPLLGDSQKCRRLEGFPDRINSRAPLG